MKIVFQSTFDDVNVSGLNDSDFITLINQNKLELDFGKSKVDVVNPKKIREVVIFGTKITFANDEIIIFLLAKELFKEYLISKNFPIIFEKLRKISDLNKFMQAESYFFYVCNLNNYSWIEIFNSNDKTGYYFFQIFSGFSDTVEYKSIEPDIIINIIKSNYETLKNDGAFNSLLTAIDNRARKDTKWANLFFNKLTKSNEEDEILYAILPNLTRGISNSLGNEILLPFVKEKISSDSHNNIKLGIMCLGFLKYFTKEDLNELEKLIDLLETDKYNNDEIQTLFVMAITNLIDSSNKCKNNIETQSKSSSLSIRPAVGFCLFRHTEAHLNSEWFANSLISIAKNAPTDNGTCHWLKMILSQLAEKNHKLFNIFFEEVIISENFTIQVPEIYPHQFTLYYNRNKPEFEHFISNWFNHDHPRYQLFLEIIFKEFFVLKYEKLELDIAYCNSLSDDDIFFIIHKVVGFTSSNVAQTYLLLSGIQKEDRSQEVFDFIHDIFVDHICYNYPSTIKLLKSISENYPSHVQKLIGLIVKSSNDYFEKRRQLNPLKELSSSEVRSKLFASMRNKQMQEAFDNAKQNRSLFMNMFKNIGLKAGEFWFSKHDGVYHPKSRLSSIEHGFEMPRGESIDPLGQSLIRRKFRLYRRNS